MTIDLPPLPQDPIVSEVRTIAERLRLAQRSAELDGSPAFPRNEFRELGDARLLGLTIPESAGGRGLPPVRAGVALFHLGYLSGTTFAKLALQPEFCSVLREHGRPEIVAQNFEPLQRGRRLIGNQITEPSAGSDAGAIESRAVLAGGQYLLNGTKSEAAFAVDAESAIVFARTGSDPGTHGVSAFLVPQDLPGIQRTLSTDMGERWMRRGTVVYHDVRVPEENRLGAEGEGFRYVRRELTHERALLAAIYLGVARYAWDATVEHAGHRTAFGRTLSEQEAIAFPLVEDWAQQQAAWEFVRGVLEQLGAGANVDAEAALAKWLATEVSLRVLDHAIQFHGGRGYSSELPFEQRWRDVRSGAIAHGTSEVMHLVAARRLWPPPRRP